MVGQTNKLAVSGHVKNCPRSCSTSHETTTDNIPFGTEVIVNHDEDDKDYNDDTTNVRFVYKAASGRTSEAFERAASQTVPRLGPQIWLPRIMTKKRRKHRTTTPISTTSPNTTPSSNTQNVQHILDEANEMLKMGISKVNMTTVPPWLLPNSKEESEILENITATLKDVDYFSQSSEELQVSSMTENMVKKVENPSTESNTQTNTFESITISQISEFLSFSSEVPSMSPLNTETENRFEIITENSTKAEDSELTTPDENTLGTDEEYGNEQLTTEIINDEETEEITTDKQSETVLVTDKTGEIHISEESETESVQTSEGNSALPQVTQETISSSSVSENASLETVTAKSSQVSIDHEATAEESQAESASTVEESKQKSAFVTAETSSTILELTEEVTYPSSSLLETAPTTGFTSTAGNSGQKEAILATTVLTTQSTELHNAQSSTAISSTEATTAIKKVETASAESGTTREEALSENILDKFSHGLASEAPLEAPVSTSAKHSKASESAATTEEPTSAAGISTSEKEKSEINSISSFSQHVETPTTLLKIIGSSSSEIATIHEEIASENILENFSNLQSNQTVAHSEYQTPNSRPVDKQQSEVTASISLSSIENKASIEDMSASSENFGVSSSFSAGASEAHFKKTESTLNEVKTLHEEALSENILEKFSHLESNKSTQEQFEGKKSTATLQRESTTEIAHTPVEELSGVQRFSSSTENPATRSSFKSLQHSEHSTSVESVKKTEATTNQLETVREEALSENILQHFSQVQSIHQNTTAARPIEKTEHNSEEGSAETTRFSSFQYSAIKTSQKMELPSTETNVAQEPVSERYSEQSKNISAMLSWHQTTTLPTKLTSIPESAATASINTDTVVPNVTPLTTEKKNVSSLKSEHSEVTSVYLSSAQPFEASRIPPKKQESSSVEAGTIQEEALSENVIGSISHHHSFSNNEHTAPTSKETSTSASIVVDLKQSVTFVAETIVATSQRTEITNVQLSEKKPEFNSSSPLSILQSSEVSVQSRKQESLPTEAVTTLQAEAKTENTIEHFSQVHSHEYSENEESITSSLAMQTSLNTDSITSHNTNFLMTLTENTATSASYAKEAASINTFSLDTEKSTVLHFASSEESSAETGAVSSGFAAQNPNSTSRVVDTKEFISSQSGSSSVETTTETGATHDGSAAKIKSTTTSKLIDTKESVSTQSWSSSAEPSTETGTAHGGTVAKIGSKTTSKLVDTNESVSSQSGSSSLKQLTETVAAHGGFIAKIGSGATMKITETLKNVAISSTPQTSTVQPQSATISSLLPPQSEGSSKVVLKKITVLPTEEFTLREEIVSEYHLEKFSQHQSDKNEIEHHYMNKTSTTNWDHTSENSKKSGFTTEGKATKISEEAVVSSTTVGEITSHPEVSTLHSLISEVASTTATASRNPSSLISQSGKGKSISAQLTAAASPHRRTLLTTDLREPMKHTVATKAEGTVSEEVFDENNLENFSHHEKSTLCEKCDKAESMGQSKGVTHPSSHQGVEGTFKHTATTQSLSKVSLEMKEENIMEHFTHRHSSTLCEICDESQKASHSVSASENSVITTEGVTMENPILSLPHAVTTEITTEEIHSSEITTGRIVLEESATASSTTSIMVTDESIHLTSLETSTYITSEPITSEASVAETEASESKSSYSATEQLEGSSSKLSSEETEKTVTQAFSQSEESEGVQSSSEHIVASTSKTKTSDLLETTKTVENAATTTMSSISLGAEIENISSLSELSQVASSELTAASEVEAGELTHLKNLETSTGVSRSAPAESRAPEFSVTSGAASETEASTSKSEKIEISSSKLSSEETEKTASQSFSQNEESEGAQNKEEITSEAVPSENSSEHALATTSETKTSALLETTETFENAATITLSSTSLETEIEKISSLSELSQIASSESTAASEVEADVSKSSPTEPTIAAFSVASEATRETETSTSRSEQTEASSSKLSSEETEKTVSQSSSQSEEGEGAQSKEKTTTEAKPSENGSEHILDSTSKTTTLGLLETAETFEKAATSTLSSTSFETEIEKISSLSELSQVASSESTAASEVEADVSRSAPTEPTGASGAESETGASISKSEKIEVSSSELSSAESSSFESENTSGQSFSQTKAGEGTESKEETTSAIYSSENSSEGSLTSISETKTLSLLETAETAEKITSEQIGVPTVLSTTLVPEIESTSTPNEYSQTASEEHSLSSEFEASSTTSIPEGTSTESSSENIYFGPTSSQVATVESVSSTVLKSEMVATSSTGEGNQSGAESSVENQKFEYTTEHQITSSEIESELVSHISSLSQTSPEEGIQNKETTASEILSWQSSSEGVSLQGSLATVEATTFGFPEMSETAQLTAHTAVTSFTSSEMKDTSNEPSQLISLETSSEKEKEYATLSSISEGISETGLLTSISYNEVTSSVLISVESSIASHEGDTTESHISSEENILVQSSKATSEYLSEAHSKQQTEEVTESQAISKSSAEAAGETRVESGLRLTTQSVNATRNPEKEPEEYNHLKTLTEPLVTSLTISAASAATSPMQTELSSSGSLAEIETTLNPKQESITAHTEELAAGNTSLESSSVEGKAEHLGVSTEEEEGITLSVKSSSTKEVEFLNNLTESSTLELRTSLSTMETAEMITASKEIESEIVVQPETSTVSENIESATSESTTEQSLTLKSGSPGIEYTQSTLVTEHVTLMTSSEIRIDLPIYLPNSSETPESFLKYYTTEMHTVIVDDEATDRTIAEEFRSMSALDFNFVTEFPVTVENTEGVEGNHTYPLSLSTESSEAISTESPTTCNEKEVVLVTSVSFEGTKKPDHKHTSPEIITTSSQVITTSSSAKQEKLTEGIIPEDLQSNYLLNACSASDYQSGSGCFCVVDDLLRRLNHAGRHKNLAQEVDSFKCENFFKVKEGVLINSENLESRIKRSYLFLKRQQESQVNKRETVPQNEIESVLKVTTHIHNTDSKIYAVPGSKVLIPCVNGEITEGSQNRYSWTSSGGRPLTEGKVQEKGGNLSIENLTAQDGGNYTCKIITAANENGKSRDHQLIIIDIPTYSVTVHIVYNTTLPCNLTDVDVMSSYLPSSMKELLCGFKCKFCDVKVRKPHCVQMGEKSHMSLYLIVSLEPFKTILPSIRTKVCDINCQMHVYSRVVDAMVRNVQNVEMVPGTLPLASSNSELKVDLFPTKAVKKKGETEVTEPVELTISCPAGFGLRKPERICAACQPNTYSAGDESYCTSCAVGEYQPVSGSKSCLSCTSPLQDPACLRIMYSNTKMFRIYVGIGFGALVLVLVLVFCCSSTAKKDEKQVPINEKHRKHYRSELSKGRRSRNPDVEQAIEPLLEGSRRNRRQNLAPPKPPPPDFL